MGFLSFLPLIQLLVNTGLAVAGQYGAVPPSAAGLATSLETALTPLWTALGNKSATQTDIMAALAASIGVLTALKNQTGLDPNVLAKVNEYLGAVQDALAAGVTASQGFNAGNYAPVAPIA